MHNAYICDARYWLALCQHCDMSRYNQSRHLCTYCLTNVAASLPASMLMSGAKFLFDLVVTKFPFDTGQKIIPCHGVRQKLSEKNSEATQLQVVSFRKDNEKWNRCSRNLTTIDIWILQEAETAVLTVVSKRDSSQEGRGKCPEGKEEEEWSCEEENADDKVARSDHAA